MVLQNCILLLAFQLQFGLAELESFGCGRKKVFKIGIYVTNEMVSEYQSRGRTVAELKQELKLAIDHTRRTLLTQLNITFFIRHVLLGVDEETENYKWNSEVFSTTPGVFPMGHGRKLENIAVNMESERTKRKVKDGKVAVWFIIYHKHDDDRRSGYANFDVFATPNAIAAVAWEFNLSAFATQGGNRDGYRSNLASMMLHEFGHVLGFEHNNLPHNLMTASTPANTIQIAVGNDSRTIGYHSMPGFARESNVISFENGSRATLGGSDAIDRICAVLENKLEMEMPTSPFGWLILGVVLFITFACVVMAAFYWHKHRRTRKTRTYGDTNLYPLKATIVELPGRWPNKRKTPPVICKLASGSPQSRSDTSPRIQKLASGSPKSRKDTSPRIQLIAAGSPKLASGSPKSRKDTSPRIQKLAAGSPQSRKDTSPRIQKLAAGSPQSRTDTSPRMQLIAAGSPKLASGSPKSRKDTSPRIQKLAAGSPQSRKDTSPRIQKLAAGSPQSRTNTSPRIQLLAAGSPKIRTDISLKKNKHATNSSRWLPLP